VGGHWLNIPESIIYRALQDLGLNFQAQASTGGGRTLGGALVDFLLLDYRIALEYQGPFHDTDMGRVQDFWRVVSRQQAGLRTVYIYQEDLRRIKDRLLEIIGRLA
jgi:very-short-patch-repair endonuclease